VYVTSIERLAKEEGRQQGLEAGRRQGKLGGLREAVREAARARVGALRADPETRLPAIESEAEFLALLARVSIATSLDELSSPSARS
jgi:predicted transposase YdaD